MQFHVGLGFQIFSLSPTNIPVKPLFQAAAEVGLRGGPEERHDLKEDDGESGDDSDSDQEEEGEDVPTLQTTPNTDSNQHSEGTGECTGTTEEEEGEKGTLDSAKELTKDTSCVVDTERGLEPGVGVRTGSNSESSSDSEPPEEEHLENSEGQPEDQDTVPSMSDQNRCFRPFRDESTMAHVNSHLEKDPKTRPRSSDSTTSCSSTAGLDPGLVKARIRSQLKKEKVRQAARRTRKHGEAAVVTRRRRDNADDIKASLSGDW